MKKLPLLLLLSSLCFSSPKGASVSQGHAEIQSIGPNTTIHTSHQAVINWDTFSVGAGERVEFVQPHNHSSVINRVQEGVSHIDGLLKANGRLFLLNPNGVLVGKNGIVSAASFLATTLDFDESRVFHGEDLLLKGGSTEAIVNCGKIEALSGDVLLLARAVINEGTLEAKKGVVGIAASREVLLKPEGSQRLYISMREGEEASIENGGVIEAARAELRADGNVYRLAINQTGVIEATGIAEENGQIVLRADGGLVEHSGTLCADSGSIHVLGEEIKIAEGALIDVSGVTGGGEILIGGDYQGANPEIPNAKSVIFEKTACAMASATEWGDGGQVILWSDEATAFHGVIEARGGVENGDGGFVEVSSMGELTYKGTSDLRPFNGEFGTLLLDPSEVTISTLPTSDIQLQGSTFVPTGATANLDPTDLVAALGLGNVIVTTQSPFGGSGNLDVNNSFTWAQPTSLTLIADQDINLLFTGSISGTGGGSIAFNAMRNFNFTAGGEVTMSGSGSVSITAQTGSCTILTNDSAPAKITTDNGNISIDAKKGISISASGTISQQVELTSANGAILFNQQPGFEDSGDVVIGDSSVNLTSITAGTGGISIRTGRDLKVLGPLELNAGTLVTSSTGISHYDVARDLIVEGGDSEGAAILGCNNGDIRIRVGRDVKVIGGKEGIALLGFFRTPSQTTGAGSLLFSEVGRNVLVQGGPGEGSFAIIGAKPISDQPWSYQGDIILQNIRGGVTVDGSQNSAIIGYGPEANATFSGRIEVSAQKDIKLNGGKASAVIGAGFDIPVATSPVVNTTEIRVDGQNITLNGGDSQFATIGASTAFDTVTSNHSVGLIDVNALGTVTLNPGTGSGTALIGVSTIEGTADARIRINADSVVLNGSTGANGGLSQILSSSGTTIVPRSILIEAKTLDVGQLGSNSGSAQIIASRRLLTLAEDDIILRASSLVEAANGLTLVSDFQGVGSLEVRDGRFEIYPGAQLNSSGPLRIFTGKRKNNLIEAPLNGVTFFPGPVYVDTLQEQWASAFPKDFGGFPFTIFYKTGLDPLWPTKSTRIFAEMFANLATYDQLLFDRKCFLFGYDRACYNQLSYPKGMVSSFDLFSETTEVMLKQKYRNYRLKYVESF